MSKNTMTIIGIKLHFTICFTVLNYIPLYPKTHSSSLNVTNISSVMLDYATSDVKYELTKAKF